MCVVLGKFDQIQKPDFKKEDIETNSLAAEVEEKLEGYTYLCAVRRGRPR